MEAGLRWCTVLIVDNECVGGRGGGSMRTDSHGKFFFSLFLFSLGEYLKGEAIIKSDMPVYNN